MAKENPFNNPVLKSRLGNKVCRQAEQIINGSSGVDLFRSSGLHGLADEATLLATYAARPNVLTRDEWRRATKIIKDIGEF